MTREQSRKTLSQEGPSLATKLGRKASHFLVMVAFMLAPVTIFIYSLSIEFWANGDKLTPGELANFGFFLSMACLFSGIAIAWATPNYSGDNSGDVA